MGFAYLYMTDQRSTGMETFGARIWWKKLRIVHSLLYFWFVGQIGTNSGASGGIWFYRNGK